MGLFVLFLYINNFVERLVHIGSNLYQGYVYNVKNVIRFR